MILKRLLTTALGALGLSALAAGSAFAQSAGSGNIPAPNIFDDQTACSMFVPITTGMNATVPMPTKVPTDGTTSPLDDAIGMGTTAVTDSTTLGLGYTIPTAGGNCGGGTGDSATGPMFGSMNVDSNDDGDFIDAGDTYKVSSVPIDVANGYTDLLAKFTAVYGDPGDATSSGTDGALKAAQKALNDAIAAGSTGTTLDPYNKAVTDAQTAHTKANAALTAASGGPIYQAGVAELQAKSAVTNAIATYNTQVTKTNAALSSLDGLRYKKTGDTNDAETSKYVPLGNSELITTVVTIAMGMGTVNLGQLIQYTNSDLNDQQVGTAAMVGKGTGDGSDGNDAPTSSNTDQSNFTAAGVLIIPMQPDTSTADDGTDLRTTKSTTNLISEIRTTVDNTNIAAAALKKSRDANTNQQTQAIYDEAYRRAQLEADYYNKLWSALLTDGEDQRTDAEKAATGDDAVAVYSISSRSSSYVTENNKRFTNEQTLRSAVATRVSATEATAAAFNSPQSFYQQLVARREALKATADKAVTDAQKDGGTASKTLLDAQTAAGDALKAARDAKSKFDSLYADPNNPQVALLSELVKTAGDDGQALANAVSSNYTAAAEAKTAADAAKAKADEVADSVAGLTGDDGSVGVNTTAIATNAENIAENTGDIEQIQLDVYGTTDLAHDSEAACSATGLLNTANCNKAGIAHNAGDIADNSDAIDDLDGRVDDNADAILDNADNIATNAGNIATNAGNIADNVIAIGENADNIAANAGNIADNADGIATNAGNISMNAGNIATNAGGIATNVEGIATNAGNISMNAENIAANAGNISMNAENIATNAGAIGENAGNIATNAAGIADNMASIGANMSAISANTNSIGANASAISRNASMIGELSDDLDVVRAGVAASMALAGIPAINGRGIAIGVGSYDGESAFAVGFQIQGEQASFKIGVTSSGGETGASAGVGFNF